MAPRRVSTDPPVRARIALLAWIALTVLIAGCHAVPDTTGSFDPVLNAATALSGARNARGPEVEAAVKPLREPQWGMPPEQLPAPLGSVAASPETLEDAWAAAHVADASLEALQWEGAARHEEFLAARSQRWPTATVAGAYTVRSNEPSILFPSLIPGFTPTLLPYAPLDQALVRGQVALPLYTGRRISSEVQAAAARSTAHEHKQSRYRLDTRLAIAEEFLAVLRAQHELETADSQVQNLTAHVRDTQALLARGSVSRQELLKAELALADARHQAIVARQALDLSSAAYNQRLGRSPETLVRLAPVTVPPSDGDLRDLSDRALAQNAEIRELQAQSDALFHEGDAEASINRPQVQMLGAYTYAENPYQDPQGLAEAGLGASWNIFDGGTARHRARARRHAAAATARLSAEVTSRVQLDVRRAWLELTSARQRLYATEQAIALAEESLRAARIRFQSGAAIGSDVLDGEALRVQAWRNHFHAHDAVALAHVRLRHATSDL
jgi:outer membrane protein